MSGRLLNSLLVCACLVAPLASGCSLRGDESDGDEILFVREETDGAAIHLLPDDGEEARRLVAGDSPRWSPDGSRFAYIVRDEQRGTSVWAMDPDTEETHRVASADSVVAFDWAPDGVRLAHTDHQRIVVVNTETGESEPVAIDYFVHGLDWSPDGRTLLVSSAASVWTLDLETGAGRSVAPRRWVEHGRWSPDGERIALAERNSPYNPRRNAFDLPADGRMESAIVITGQSGGSGERVTDGAFDLDPAWSDDGQRIYFTRQPASRLDEPSREEESEIYVVDLESRSLGRLTETATDRLPDPRPDDRSLPSPPEPTTGDVVVPDLVDTHVLIEDETRRFEELGLELETAIPPDPDWLMVVNDQAPRGGSRVPEGTVVRLDGFDLSSLYATPNIAERFSAETWKAHPGCDADRRARMYFDLVDRVLQRGMPREEVLALLGKPGTSDAGTATWPIGVLSTEPVDCIYLRVEFDPRGRATRFHQSVG